MTETLLEDSHKEGDESQKCVSQKRAFSKENERSEKMKNESENKGKSEILYNGFYYDVKKFIPKHPGGSIIKYYSESGEDATCAIQQFHKRSANKVMGIMNCFKRRPAAGTEARLTRNKILNEDFLKFYKELEDEGMFKPDIVHVGLRLGEALVYFTLAVYFTMNSTGYLGTALSIFFLTLYQMRLGWIQHEGGHNSLTGFPIFDKYIQLFTMSMLLGLSSSWWNRNHNMHHAMPNRFHRDHDLDTLPILAFNKIVVKKPAEGKSFFIQNQAYLFIPITNFIGKLFWLLYLHPKYTIQKKSWFVLSLMVLHWMFVYNFFGLIPYFISLWIHTNYYFAHFSLSHTHLPVVYQEELHWIEYAFLHSMDVQPSWWCDWWMGYLNYQIEHHLFPTMPQFRGQIIRDRVKKFAEDHGLPYHCESYLTACKLTFDNMRKVSNEVKHL